MRVVLRFDKFFRQIMDPSPPSRVEITIDGAEQYVRHLELLPRDHLSSGQRIELMRAIEKIKRAIQKAKKSRCGGRS